MSMETVLRQASWKVESDRAKAYVAQVGAMVAPLEFELGDHRRQVFHVAPWADETIDAPPILQALRGDFFCMPFGLTMTPYQGQWIVEPGSPRTRQTRTGDRHKDSSGEGPQDHRVASRRNGPLFARGRERLRRANHLRPSCHAQVS